MRILFQPIKSKHKNWTVFADELKKELDATAKPDLIQYFERVVKSWKHKPQFKAMKRVRAGGISVYVYPTGDNAKYWTFVTGGTRPHVIRPKHAGGVLVFPWGGYGSYKPKTSRGGRYGGPGIVSNAKIVAFTQVNHPGNEAREFEKHIARWYGPEFRRNMRNAIKRGARR